MTTKQVLLGTLAIFITAASIYIVMPDADVKMRIDNDKSVFYAYDNRWLISGEEWNKLFDGTSLVRRHAKDVTLNEYYDFDKNTSTFVRTTPYYSGATIVDTYVFDGMNTDVEQFPVSHTIEIQNAVGLIYQYEVRRLSYDGATIKGITSPQSFGMNMKVEYDDGYYYSRIYKYANKDEGKLTVKYRITEDYVRLDMRLFDPVSITIDSPTNTTYDTETVWFNVTLNETGDWCGYSLDGAANTSMDVYSAQSDSSVLPAEDSYVDSDYPTTNYDAHPLYVQNQTGFETRIYISIGLDDIASTITSISEMKLQLYSIDLVWPDTWVHAHYVNDTANTAFVENTITWNNQPCGTLPEALNSSCSDSIDAELVTSGGWVVFDVTDAAQWVLANIPDNVMTIVMRVNMTTDIHPYFRDKEYATASLRPKFNISYTFENKSKYNHLNTSMTEGYHSAEFSCNDTNGEVSSDTVYFTVDTTPPTITINYPLNATTESGLFNVTFDETVSWSAYSLNGAANVSMGAVSTYETTITSGFVQGSNYITVSANDSLGNMNSTTRYFTTVPNASALSYGTGMSSIEYKPKNMMDKYVAPTGQTSTNPSYYITSSTYPDGDLQVWLDSAMATDSWLTISNTSSYSDGLNLTTSAQTLNYTVSSSSNVSVWVWLSLDYPSFAELDPNPGMNFNFTY